MPTTSGRKDPGKKAIRTFAEYQAMVERTDERKKVIVSLLGLAGELGDLNSTFKSWFFSAIAELFAAISAKTSATSSGI